MGGLFVFLFFNSAFFFCYLFFYFEKSLAERNEKRIVLRIKRLIIPYVFWGIFGYLILELFGYRFEPNELLKQILLGVGINNPLWFSFDLIIISCFFIFLYKINKGIPLYLLLITFVLAVVLQNTNINYYIFTEKITFLSGGRLSEMLPYAIIGAIISHYKVYERLENNWKVFITLLVISVMIFISKNSLYTPNGFNYQGMYRIISTTCLVSFFYFMPIAKIPCVFKQIIEFLSKYTMGVYFSHYPIGRIVVLYIDKTSDMAIVDKVIMYCERTLIIYVLSFLLCFFVSKIPNKTIKELVC